MGKARIRMSWEFIQTFLQMPSDWKPCDANVQITGFSNEPTYWLDLIVTGESIEDKDELIELNPRFISKTFEDKDGKWIQGHWETFR